MNFSDRLKSCPWLRDVIENAHLLIIEGKPGTGKTLLAKGIAEARKELGHKIRIVDPYSVRSEMESYLTSELHQFLSLVADRCKLVTNFGFRLDKVTYLWDDLHGLPDLILSRSLSKSERFYLRKLRLYSIRTHQVFRPSTYGGCPDGYRQYLESATVLKLIPEDNEQPAKTAKLMIAGQDNGIVNIPEWM